MTQPLITWDFNPVFFSIGSLDAVSYTHLDVYKRQPLDKEMDSDLKVKLESEIYIGRAGELLPGLLPSGRVADALPPFISYVSIKRPSSSWDTTGMPGLTDARELPDV